MDAFNHVMGQKIRLRDKDNDSLTFEQGQLQSFSMMSSVGQDQRELN